jgi:hypothetical protein
MTQRILSQELRERAKKRWFYNTITSGRFLMKNSQYAG